eukprot:TRINITY_DN9662_c0_g1_i1.p1 TRINITY_DN9662_c0_g1~~TRINITY_DN9662_c0_g1_i1.p1  ORF type:complete len:422 (+),score=56.97 TRINITY_DN9662_c0_g1_i1:37-1302(+)
MFAQRIGFCVGVYLCAFFYGPSTRSCHGGAVVSAGPVVMPPSIVVVLAACSVADIADIPSDVNAPMCSIDATVAEEWPASTVLHVSDGVNPRCAVVLVPPGERQPLPMLFDFHGAGGNARNFGVRKDMSGVSWADLALKNGFAVIAGEATQFGSKPVTPGPAPMPVPSDCLSCFSPCSPVSGAATCQACVKGMPRDCAATCGAKDHIPFPTILEAVCNGKRSPSEADASFAWHGGQWLIPEVQTDDTGIKCSARDSREIAYIANVVKAAAALGVVDTSAVFLTGCSMGSALTVWLAQCLHQADPQQVTAFGSQSTGVKVKGDGLHFPKDNYNGGATEWGECDACQYFPAPVVRTSGLKACIVDQTGDNDFYRSSLNLNASWHAAGMAAEAEFTDGGHCQTASYEWIARCMDDGTGRLMRGQ